MLGKLNAPPAGEPVQKVRFGNFEIMNDPEGRPLALGKGTFGRTYQARHCYLDTIVALKIITERYATDPAVRERFLIEARAVAKLSHPHIARLYDFGEVDGVLHYAMEYCGGGSLADYVAKHGPLGVRQVLEVGQQIAGALKCAQAAGFIHRDLKPSNIMLTSDQEPLYTKLIDFGLVQASIPGATRSIVEDQSADGARFLGTPLFASPEQLREEPMDVRTDVFSLGITLWYLLLGGPPEAGSSAAIAASRLSAESYTARLPTNIPPQLRDVLSKMLEKDRNKRFAAAADAFAALNLCAGTLGFRRARDYTDPLAELSEWEDDAGSGQAPTAESGQLEPIEVQQINGELSTEFNIVTRINEDFTGLNYAAVAVNDPDAEAILHVLHPMVLEDTASFNRVRINLAQLVALDFAEVTRPKSLKNYSDYTAVILEKPSGTDLMSILRTERTVQLIEAAPLLEQIADACDTISAAGLPGLQLAPGRVFVQWEAQNAADNRRLSKARPKLYPRFLAVSEAPELARINEPEDVSSTMTTDMLSDPSRADNMPEHFGTLVYRVVAGRNCPMAASLSSQAYVAIPGLSEHSNRLLSLVIAKQIASTSCGQILREILGAEGIVPRVPGHSTAGFTARGGTGSTIVPETPGPFGRKIVSPIATPALTPTPARQWRPPVVRQPSILTPAVARQAPVILTPPVVPKLPPEPTPAPVVTAKAPAPPAAPPVAEPPLTPVNKVSEPIVTAKAPTLVLPPEPRVVEPPVAPAAKKIIAPIEPPAPPVEKAAPVEKIVPEPVTVKSVAKEISKPVEKIEPRPLPSEKAKPIDKISPPPLKEKAVAKEVPELIKKIEAPADKFAVPEKIEPPAEKLSPQVAQAKTTDDREKFKPAILPPPQRVSLVAKAREKLKKVSQKAEVTETRPKKPEAEPALTTAKAETAKPASPSLPTILPSLIKQAAPPIERAEKARFKPEFLWNDPRARGIGIGIAALALITISYATVRNISANRTATKASVVPAPVSKSIAAGPITSKPPGPRLNAGRYVGKVRSQNRAGVQEFTREISLDPGLTSGYVIEYSTDPKKQVPLSQAQIDQDGILHARALFADATEGTNRDETVTVNPDENNTLQVSFESPENTLSGALHPWSNDDQLRYNNMMADLYAAAAAEQKRKAEEVAVAAQPEAAAKLALQPANLPPTGQPSPNEHAPASKSTHHRAPTGNEAPKSAGPSTRQAAPAQHAAPAAPPAAKTVTRPAPAPKAAGEHPQPKSAFGEGPPGG